MYLIVSTLFSAYLQVAGWEIFTATQFRWEYVEEVGLEVQMPIFDQKLKDMEGELVTLTGYYLPLDLNGNTIILSKLPYASCFFCGGGGGPESIAEVVFKTTPRRFKMDEILTVKGRLVLNRDDLNHQVFILIDATAS